MAVTLNELRILTLRKIDEAYDSTAAEVADGSGGVLRINTTTWATGTDAYLTTLNTLTDLINEAQNFWARTAFAIEGSASKSWTSGVSSFPLSGFTDAASQGNLFAAETVVWNTTTLTKCGKDVLAREIPNFRVNTAGTPSYWYQVNETIHLYVKPSSTQTVTAYGFALPQQLSESGTTSASFMRDDLLRSVIPTAAALILVRRKATDPSLATRVGDLEGELTTYFNKARAAMPTAIKNTYFTDVPSDLVSTRR